jgi:putative two-component system response regulator
MLETNVQFVINILMAYVITVAVCLTGLIALVRHFSWNRPMRKLSEAASKIARGDFSERISPIRKDGKNDYVEVLFDDFNSMTEELNFMHKNMQKIINEKTMKIEKLQNAILKTMADLMEYRDDVTGSHQERIQYGVGLFLEEIRKKGLYRDTIIDWDSSLVIQSAQLHDVGKIAISDQILNKPGPLTIEKNKKMKKHVVSGLKIIERIETDSGENDLLNHAKIFAFAHHEKWNGSGYPNGLYGEQIPLQGRIMAIVDVYDAIVSERPYKKAFTHEKAVEAIMAGKGIVFDPALIDLFINISEKFR